jgi:hypothetical protein
MFMNALYALAFVILGLAGGAATYSSETFMAFATQCVACGP